MKIQHFLIAIGVLALAACSNGAKTTSGSSDSTSTKVADAPAEDPAPAGRYATGDQLYVYAKSGLTLRETPDPNGAKISNIPNGSAVTVEDTEPFQHGHSTQEPCGLTINGYWVKVNAAGKSGYLFDGYLLEYKPIKEEQTVAEYWDAISKRKSSTDTPPEDDVEYFEYLEIVWENGVKLTESGYEGGANSKLTLPRKMFSLQEGYLFAVVGYFIFPEGDFHCTCKDKPGTIECMTKDDMNMVTAEYDSNGDVEIKDSTAD